MSSYVRHFQRYNLINSIALIRQNDASLFKSTIGIAVTRKSKLLWLLVSSTCVVITASVLFFSKARRDDSSDPENDSVPVLKKEDVNDLVMRMILNHRTEDVSSPGFDEFMQDYLRSQKYLKKLAAENVDEGDEEYHLDGWHVNKQTGLIRGFFGGRYFEYEISGKIEHGQNRSLIGKITSITATPANHRGK